MSACQYNARNSFGVRHVRKTRPCSLLAGCIRIAMVSCIFVCVHVFTLGCGLACVPAEAESLVPLLL